MTDTNLKPRQSPETIVGKFAALSSVNLALLMAAYARFFITHYSSDTYIVYARDDSLVNIRNGRPLAYLCYKVCYALNLQNPASQPFVTAWFLLLLAFCTSVLALLALNNLDRDKQTMSCAYLLNASFLLVFINGMFLDWMRFPECYPMYGCALGLMVLALVLTFQTANGTRIWGNRGQSSRRKNIAIKLASIALVLLAASWFYQTVLFFYIQISLGICLANSARDFKRSVKVAILAVAASVFAGIASQVI